VRGFEPYDPWWCRSVEKAAVDTYKHEAQEIIEDQEIDYLLLEAEHDRLRDLATELDAECKMLDSTLRQHLVFITLAPPEDRAEDFIQRVYDSAIELEKWLEQRDGDVTG
jgi:hypothetical protein